MPQLEAKNIQQELKQGKLRPVYWLYGTERMKSRELLKRIRTQVNPNALNEVNLDGNECGSAEILDACQSMGFGGGTRFVVVREAHAIKDADVLEVLLESNEEPPQTVTVFLSKDLDGRKKFSKTLTKKAAVVPCEDIEEDGREAWIGFLAKRRNLEISAEASQALRVLDPWSLDIVDQELEKISLFKLQGPEESAESVIQGGSEKVTSQAFMEALFTRNQKASLTMCKEVAQNMDQTLPLLGLIAWNVRHLMLMCSGAPVKLNPYVEGNLRRWKSFWSLERLLAFQSDLAQFDFDLKQTGKTAQGLWASFILRNG